MANLGRKDGIYHARFRYLGREYKNSLKTREKASAHAALHFVEVTIHRLITGLAEIPPGVDAGDHILSGGVLAAPPHNAKSLDRPSTSELVQSYLLSQKHLLAASSHATDVLGKKVLADKRENINQVLARVKEVARRHGVTITPQSRLRQLCAGAHASWRRMRCEPLQRRDSPKLEAPSN